MKPCKSCPFRPDSLPGLWSPAHYIGIAYLGSADIPGPSMGCHSFNGMVNPALSAEKPPLCGGWVRAARDSVQIRLAVMFGGQDEDECFDSEAVMSPEEMARQNGVDVDMLPPLRYDPTRYPGATGMAEWASEIIALRNQLHEDPESAWEYVLPGSPLDIGVSESQIAEALGSKNKYTAESS